MPPMRLPGEFPLWELREDKTEAFGTRPTFSVLPTYRQVTLA